MDSFRVASLCFVVALAIAPLPAQAQAPPSGGGSLNLTELAARVTALEANLAAERAARMAADTTLQTNINNEVSNRVGAVAAEISARQAADTTLQGQIDKLKGNITAADLEGTYNFYMVVTAIDGGPSTIATIASYVITGTITFGSGGTGGGTGQAQGTVVAGSKLTEQLPSANWLFANLSGSGVFDGSFSWVYNNGVVTINAGGDINDLTPAAGGQVMVGVQGGSPGYNQAILVLTRQP